MLRPNYFFFLSGCKWHLIPILKCINFWHLFSFSPLIANVTWWLTETRRWEWYSPPVELKLSSSQKVTVWNECGSYRCSHLSDPGSPDIGRGKRKWSQMIGGGTPNGSGVPFPSTEVNTKKGGFWASLVADGR